uniref:Uncharacterized protein n=1 Tax=Oryza punctata TaxID=4537 RepID=A0A0E0KI87_ORYPU
MAVWIKKCHDQVAAAAALLMVFSVVATFHFHPLHARPVTASGSLHPTLMSYSILALATAPTTLAAAASGGEVLPKSSSSPSGCTNYGPGGGTICPPH